MLFDKALEVGKEVTPYIMDDREHEMGMMLKWKHSVLDKLVLSKVRQPPLQLIIFILFLDGFFADQRQVWGQSSVWDQWRSWMSY